MVEPVAITMWRACHRFIRTVAWISPGAVTRPTQRPPRCRAGAVSRAHYAGATIPSRKRPAATTSRRPASPANPKSVRWHLLGQVRDVQQRLRWNTATVQARAPHQVALHDGDLQAVPGGAQSGGIATGSPAQDRDIDDRSCVQQRQSGDSTSERRSGRWRHQPRRTPDDRTQA